MSVNVIDYFRSAEGEIGAKFDCLCKDDWRLPSQMEVLQKWLAETGKNFASGSYVVDMEFNPRDGACGGMEVH